MTKKDINFALVEETRPPIYTAMKYWGKKPHNIWYEYIKNYTPENGLYLDPFMGSAMSAFEAFKAGKKAIAFDLNPISSFIIEVLVSDFSKNTFRQQVEKIISDISTDNTYKEFFLTVCRKCGSKTAIVQNFKWNKGKLYELGIHCNECNRCNKVKKYSGAPNKEDNKKASNLNKINIGSWYPNKEFLNSQSFSANFKSAIGGSRFSDLWTKRNLYVLSEIFDRILKNKDKTLKQQLLFGFIQTIHLCTKMSVPRAERGNRPFSTSWGRSAYICSSRQMEMNPLMIFKGSCLGKQSVESALEYCKEYLFVRKPKLFYVDAGNKSNRSKNFDIKYGIIDINIITDYVDEETIDFMMTDPPYGGLVQYLDLSSIWLIWLEKYDKKYKPNYAAEITINKGRVDFETYKIRFQKSLKNLYKILKPNGKIVFTFHNKKISIWNTFLKSLSLAGFKIEKIIHQQNRRTGESNVSNPYGTSATDFYIRCIKRPVTNLKTDKDKFEHFIIKKAIELIAQRNEPTPFQILFNGLLVEISEAGFDLEDFDLNVEKILSKYVGEIFECETNRETKSGNLWWFKTPANHIRYPDRQLEDRIEESIVFLLRRKVSVTFDDVLAEIFVKYPNGLTPDIKSMGRILEKYAIKSGGKWIYRGGIIEREFTRHTEILFHLIKIGHKLGFRTYVGKREQSEKYQDKKLLEYATCPKITHIKNLDKYQIARIKMIDMLWLSNPDKITYALEVENSTKFTSGIQRASNLDKNIPKIMVVPDTRKQEFNRNKDPLFIDSFRHHGWKYIYYSDIESLSGLRNLSIDKLIPFSKEL